MPESVSLSRAEGKSFRFLSRFRPEKLRLDPLILAGLAEASEQEVYSTAARVWPVGRR
jgi:hypothetical protein